MYSEIMKPNRNKSNWKINQKRHTKDNQDKIGCCQVKNEVKKLALYLQECEWRKCLWIYSHSVDNVKCKEIVIWK
jgi:ribosomal protein S15P/S13E